MVRIVNPFRGTDPIAQTISQLGQNMFGGQLGRMVDTEKLVALQRENQETDNLMGRVGQTGAASLAADPVAQAMLLGSGYKPDDFGKMGLLETAVTKGAAAPATQNFQVGTGQAFDNTADAFGAKLDETARNNDMASADRRYGVDQALVEAIVNGKPQYVQNSQAAGMQPVLSNTDVQGTFAQNNFGSMGDLPPAEQAYLGADVATGGKTPRNYVAPSGTAHITYDGVTDAQTNMPLEPGGYIAGVEGNAADTGVTNAVTTDLQTNVIAADSFLQSVDAMIALTDNPANFGLPGMVRTMGQEVAQGAGAVIGMFGGEPGVQQKAAQARGELERNGLTGLIPELYDPALPAIDMLAGVLLYQGASVLAGQENRSVSDKDVGLMRQILGDPKSLFESAQSVRTKMMIAKAMATNHKTLAQQYLDQGMAVPQGLAEAALSQAITQITQNPGGPNLSPAPAAGGEAQEGDTAVNPTTGERIQLVKGQWVPM